MPGFKGVTGQVLRPPLRDRRFWVIQFVILALVMGHLLLDLHKSWLPAGIPDYPTVGLFLLPVIYAALKFGMGGACASAAWGTILMIPDLFVVDSRADLWSDGTLLVLICVVAVAVGQRVERETIARQRADLAIRAHTAAEARFRALFEASSAPTLVTDNSGALREANPAAKALFGARLGRRQLADLVGDGVSRRLLAQTPPKLLPVVLPDGTGRVLHPLSTLVTDSGDDPLLQIILQDVTEDEERQRQTESFAIQVVRVQEQERRRIGQDIHDEPLQTLIYLSRRLEAIADDGNVLAAHRDALANMRQILVGVVVQLRQLADGLRPPVLDDIGLAASLRQLVAGFSDRSETKASLHVSGTELDLGWDRKTDVYRIVQEALRNVERHASASHVAVHLSFAKRTVRVKVQDDGCGFRVDTTVPGLGLRGMSERATLAQGRLEVNSVPGQGTTVHLTMSVAAATRPSDGAASPTPGGQRRPRKSAPGRAGSTGRPAQASRVLRGGSGEGSRAAVEPVREIAPRSPQGLGSGLLPG
ncbi:MAG TPA: ATP-binding protein [Candidatus Nanopelagicaceae bacterium]|nr:ATP-binding protein [Candidatus Nanopelagicaceae bacterium]